METTSARLIAIGDIHGCYDELRAILEALAPTPDDTIVFLGDYVDRGPDSAAVIRHLTEFAAAEGAPACIFLRGNHEQLMLDAQAGGPAFELWIRNGGHATIESFAQALRRSASPLSEHWQRIIDADAWRFVASTVLMHRAGPYLFVHGGFDPDLPPGACMLKPNLQAVLWERRHLEPGRDLSAWGDDVVVCGHTIQSEPVDLPNLVCIDTGAFLAYTHRRPTALTAVILPDDPTAPREFVSVPAAGRVAAGATA